MYTRTLLEALDIPSYYTLVTATEDQKDVIREDFPSPFFNHVFLTVPLEGDTLWLECTSSIPPFGYLGTFTSDRHALLIDDKGGRLIRTRAYSMEENRTDYSRIVFEENGSAAAALDRTYTGMEIERDRFAFLHQAQALDQKNWFYDHLGGKVRELTGYRLKPLSDEVVPQTGFTAEVQFSQMAQNASGRLFIPLSTLTAGLSADLPEEARSAPLEVDHPYTETDSLVLVFPAGMFPKVFPRKSNWIRLSGNTSGRSCPWRMER